MDALFLDLFQALENSFKRGAIGFLQVINYCFCEYVGRFLRNKSHHISPISEALSPAKKIPWPSH
jgi:hypothetical protein